MGLLDAYLPEDKDKADAIRMGLLSAGAQMIANAGQGFGGAAGMGLLGGAEGYQSARKNSVDLAQKQMKADLMRQMTGGSAGSSAGGTGASSGQPQGGLSLDMITRGAMLGIPGMDTAFNVYKYQNDGIERKAGTWYKDPATGQMQYVQDPKSMMHFDPNSNTITPYAGAAEAQAALEGAKTRATEGAKADFQLLPLDYTNPNGTPYGGTVGGYIRNLPQSQPLPQGTPTPASFPKVSPQEQKDRDAEKFRIIKAEYDAETNPQNKAALQRELNRLQFNGGPALQSKVEQTAQLESVKGKQGTVNELNKNWISSVHNPIQDDGKAARAVIGQLDTLGNINFQTGWNADNKAAAANVLASFGVKDAAKYATNAQKFQQVAMERNMTMLQAQKGPQTEGDSQRAQQTFVQLQNTPQANQYIMDLTRANANLAAKKAAFYNEALPLATQQGDLTEIDRRWSKIAPSIWNDPALAKYRGK